MKKSWFKKNLGQILAITLVIVMGTAIDIPASNHKQALEVAAAHPKIPSYSCNLNASKILGYVNTERVKLGSPQLKVDRDLSITSRKKVNDMIAKKYYGHKFPNGGIFVKYIRAQGVQATVSQDIDSGTLIEHTTSRNIWEDFKKSPEHYKSLINPLFTRVGISANCVHYEATKDTDLKGKASKVDYGINGLVDIDLASPEPVVQPQVQYAPSPQPVDPNVGITHCDNDILGTGVTCYSY